MKKISLILFLTFLLNLTCSFSNNNNTSSYLMQLDEIYLKHFDKIEYNLAGAKPNVTLYIYGREDSSFLIKYYLAAFEYAYHIYKKDSILPITIRKIRSKEDNITSDKKISSTIFGNNLLAIIKVIEELDFEKIRNYFLQTNWEVYDMLRYNFDFFKQNFEKYYSNEYQLDFYIFYSVLSSSKSYYLIENLNNAKTKQRVTQPLIDLYVMTKTNLIYCEYHYNKDPVSCDLLVEGLNLQNKFLEQTLIISGYTKQEIEEIDWKDISPELVSEKIKSFEDVKKGKHYE